jgi:nuclear pore complex protein Nup53
MFSSTSYPATNPGAHQGHPQEHRPGFPHSHSQPFTVAGMSSQNAIHSPSVRSSTLAGSSGLNVGGSLGDSLNQSRSHYQPGYLLVCTLLSIVSVSNQVNNRVPAKIMYVNDQFNHSSSNLSGCIDGFTKSAIRRHPRRADESQTEPHAQRRVSCGLWHGINV